MRLVALVRAPTFADEAARALAEASGLTLAEARMRLAPEPPALIARLDDDKAQALVSTLRKVGLSASSIDLSFPTEKERTPVHRFALGPAGGTFTTRSGDSFQFAWPDVLAVLRGIRSASTHVIRTEKSQRFSPGLAVMTGGLVMSRTTTKAVHSTSETMEQVILVYLRDGRAATLAEHDLELSCLGPGMQASSTANMAELARRLREHAGTAFYDERLLRLGRRPLPFLMGRESRSDTAATVTTRSDTSSSLDALAEVMRRAVVEGLLP